MPNCNVRILCINKEGDIREIASLIPRLSKSKVSFLYFFPHHFLVLLNLKSLVELLLIIQLTARISRNSIRNRRVKSSAFFCRSSQPLSAFLCFPCIILRLLCLAKSVSIYKDMKENTHIIVGNTLSLVSFDISCRKFVHLGVSSYWPFISDILPRRRQEKLSPPFSQAWFSAVSSRSVLRRKHDRHQFRANKRERADSHFGSWSQISSNSQHWSRA